MQLWIASARAEARGCDVVAHDSVEDEVISSSRPGLRSLALSHATVCVVFDFNVRPLLRITALVDSRLTPAQIRVPGACRGVRANQS